MSEDIAKAAALLQAEGLIEPTDEEVEPAGWRITTVGYNKALEKWMKLTGEDRLLFSLFLAKVGWL